ncbi:hypothetical protein BDV11DRAFT_214090 [Aspergillus similis]
MSGVEVVGILLGAIPLVVSALKTYKETKQRYIWFMNKEPYINRLIQSLNEQIYFIRADVDIALQSTGLEHDKIKAFLSDPDLDFLSNQEVADAIRDYLGEGLQLYLDALARCQNMICNIVKNLNGLVSGTRRLESANLADIVRDTPKRNGDFEFRKKIKFSLQKEEIDAQITDLEASAKVLSRINKQSTRREVVAVQSSSRKITKFASTLASVRNSAHRLYTAISRGYIHACHDEHETFRKPPVSFEVAFCKSKDTAWTHNAWSYKTEIQVIERDGDVDDFDNRTQPVVTFKLPDTADTTTSGLNEIHNLCSLVYSAHMNRASVDLCLSGGGRLCYINRPARNKAVPPHTKEFLSPVSLTTLLTGTHPIIPPIPLNHRIAISYNIASAIFQLHSTPWLSLPLRSSSVFFIPDGNIKHHKNSRDTCKYSMLELGILLLELWHSHTIESFAADNGLTLARSFGSRYDVAMEWISHSEDEGDMMPFYLEAATRCIECTFITSSARPDWNDVTFQKSVCQYLLKPLLDNCPAKYK